ncbi:MAG: DCC1-like thiol-disulfide oxidoreductase family protein [Bacteroidota bacterium]|nr:DCC1-like thiol-disulfide oxidoreductase family protein [Bacteroidota bacterium]
MNIFSERIIFFDGLCVLCNASVKLILKYDKTESLKFASLQSDFAREHLGDRVDLKNIEYLLYLRNGQLYKRSDAALYIAKDTQSILRHVFLLRFVPRPVRDFVYELTAKYRYKLFGKKERCMVPAPNVRHRFFE